MTPQIKQLYEAAKAFVESEENRFILFVNLCEAVDAYTQHIGKHEPSLDKLAETVLREYVKFKDVNGSKSVSLLPLTIVDIMGEFIDRVNEQPEAIAGEKTIEEVYKEWCGKSHIENSSHPVHDSEECMEFAKYFFNQQTSAKEKEIEALKYEPVRLYDWLTSESHEPSQTAFTSGIIRNIAKEIEFQLHKKDKEIAELKQRISELESNLYELHFCSNCFQMTNHLNGVCQKCKELITERFIEWKESLRSEIRGSKLMYDIPRYYRWLNESELLNYFIDYVYLG